MQAGSVEAIYISAEAEVLPTAPSSRSQRSRGQGPRGRPLLPTTTGTFSDKPRSDGSDITLVEAEAVEGLARDTGIELGPPRPAATSSPAASR